MEELYIEGLANHDDREPCVGAREGAGEASVAARAGRAIEPRNHCIRGADVVYGNGRQYRQQPVPEQGRWLGSVVRGHLAYYAVPGNIRAVHAFRHQVSRHSYQALRRRSQRTRLDWARMNRLIARWLPPVRIVHPYPEVRFAARTRGKSPVR